MQFKKRLDSISIIGCGWYGFELAKELIFLGHAVKGSTTSASKLLTLAEAGIKPYLIEFEEGKKAVVQDFFKSDILIICIPPKRHTNQTEQYPEKIKKIGQFAVTHRVKKVIF